jgi:hypothetical protein
LTDPADESRCRTVDDNETVESLRLVTAFLSLAPGQRLEVVEQVERLATDPEAVSDHPLP